MALTFFSLTTPFMYPHSLCLKPSISQFKPLHGFFPLHRRLRSPAVVVSAGNFDPNPADDDPPEAPEDSAHGLFKFQQIQRQAARARKREEEQFKKDQSTFLNAIADVEDAPDNVDSIDAEGAGDDLFGEIDKAIAMKRKEFVKQGLLKPNPKKESVVPEEIAEGIEELEPDEVVDLEEINELRGLTVISEDLDDEESEKLDDEESDSGNVNGGSSSHSSFDVDFDSFGESGVRIVEPKFRMSLAELLDESKVVPYRFMVIWRKTDGHLYLSEADKRGAVAVVASKEIDIEETLGCKALVIVEDTSLVLPALAAAFYGHPSKIWL
ncbi:UDP-N-acetylmuramoyl-L-alanyl-D-glutamate--2,6-diaminopimelate ligase MurE-like, chloroplastic [Vitis vinifera]|uniref:UDP-N-acetylmuramoyl-L-alanyl-D-glutamate--2, 6-diaminopimelate ligase MurE-like, chloroplastic n=1 Tax=Vitis vinifera TaxID=29760 RepID=A0A438BZF4_VITVI|nr:UDP-N-acetylmuramoyl-L-alanyl-D-glutamate--2,6-diaminopimelate ligase MurE-like, chloroplastic [Vitis vinifera]